IDPSLPHFTSDDVPLLKNSKSIRLLKIKPAIFLADVLDCELISVSLDGTATTQAPEFDALSYRWQTADPTYGSRTILVNGKQMQIQESQAQALHRYRRLGCSIDEQWQGKAEYIWADGICIDQSNLPEKTIQVGMMGQVYKKAKRVYIDLGDVPDGWYYALVLMYKYKGSCGIFL
ncbi:heterokaryon incompatibility protein-domain-containing protein, partial [Podospora fimiseda]